MTGRSPELFSYAEVLLPQGSLSPLTYGVPQHLRASVMWGVRAQVPLRNSRFVGIIVALHNTPPPVGSAPRNIIEVIDEEPLILVEQWDFWQWLAGYYLCPLGAVMRVALPAPLQLDKRTLVSLSARATEGYTPREGLEADLLSYLAQHGPIRLTDLEDAFAHGSPEGTPNAQLILSGGDVTDRPRVARMVGRLNRRGLVALCEEFSRRVVGRQESWVGLSEGFQTPESVGDAVGGLNRTPAQQRAFLALAMALQKQPLGLRDMLPRSEVLELDGVNAGALLKLRERDLVSITLRPVSRFRGGLGSEPLPTLTGPQEEALMSLVEATERRQPALLHGVAGSGKRELYTHLIARTLARGEQVLYLLPEISIASHVEAHLRRYFGGCVASYHSLSSDSMRYEVYHALLYPEHYEGALSIIVGARSALFLPFSRLGLIIVDQEHDGSYKQHQLSPLYNGRDAALVLAHMSKAAIVLGSSTPSLESYTMAKSGRYALVRLLERYPGLSAPRVEIVDIREFYRRKQMKGHFSPPLIEGIRGTLEAGKKVVLFQNRRGYAPRLSCDACGWVAGCTECSVSLTLHTASESLSCHYCGQRHRVPPKCPQCGSPTLRATGLGTQRVEEEVAALFGAIPLWRLDFDTARGREGAERIVRSFVEGEAGILVGTRMLSRGLELKDVGLVGVLYADGLLRAPNFRANERAFQLLTQVCGRAGRSGGESRALIQTMEPEHPVLGFAARGDYESFAGLELESRHRVGFPPYMRLTRLRFMHKESEQSRLAASGAARLLAPALGAESLLGPSAAAIERIRGQYIQELHVRIPRDARGEDVKRFVLSSVDQLRGVQAFRGVSITIDVDTQ